MTIILIVHVFVSFFMTGLCWFIQIAHYPLFRELESENLPYYERKNVLFTAYVTVPLMVVELLTGLILLYQNVDVFHVINVSLLLVIALSTLIFQAPIHLQLMRKSSTELMDRLIQTNWIRTISWTIRSGVLFYLLYVLIEG